MKNLKRLESALDRLIVLKGGPGSGHFGHAGRPGLRGGSAPLGVVNTASQARAVLRGFQAGALARIEKLEAKSKELNDKARQERTDSMRAGGSWEASPETISKRDTVNKKIRDEREKLAERERRLLKVENPTKANIQTTPSIRKDPRLMSGINSFRNLISEDALPESATTKVKKTRKNRDFYRNDDGTVNIKSYSTLGTVVHELGHFAEYRGNSILEKTTTFWQSRTEGERFQSLRGLTGLNYGRNEVAKPDKFDDPYSGKIYTKRGVVRTSNINLSDIRSTEIFSMGIQAMYESPSKFARNDPEYFDFIYNTSRGK